MPFNNSWKFFTPSAGAPSWKTLYLAQQRPSPQPAPPEEPEEPETPVPPVVPDPEPPVDEDPEPETPEPEEPEEPETPPPPPVDPEPEEPQPPLPPVEPQPPLPPVEPPVDEDPEPETPEPEEPEEPETPPPPPVEPPVNEDPEPEDPGTPNTPPSNGDAVAPVPLGQTTTVEGGRVTTFSVGNGQDIASIRITDAPEHGVVTVNPDNTLALVLSGSDHSGALSFGYDVTYANGATESRDATLNVTAPKHQAGWGEGKHYMLETDANGDLVIETGDNHRKVYVSGSDDALTAADIAAREGVSEGTVTGKWLLDHPEYGGSEGKALANDIGMEVWRALLSEALPAGSHWLMFEKGYSYESGRLIHIGAMGESPLHPLYISSWGEGEQPTLEGSVRIYQKASNNIVFDDVHITGGFQNLGSENLIINDTDFSERGLNIQNVDGFTLRGSDISHVITKEPTGEFWKGTVAGIFAHAVEGLLMEENIFHQNGWQDDYRPDGSAEGGMPPNMFSHNVYLQNTTSDVTFRDNIISQGASYGAQIRGGGFVEDNVFVDNNAAVNMLGGVYQDDGPIGNSIFFADNLITSGGHKTWTHGAQGGLTLGLTDRGYDTTFLNNIIAHLADPNNSAELASKPTTNQPFSSINGSAYDDTIIFNWKGSGQVWNLVSDNGRVTNTDLANQTTIQNFAAQLLGQNKATIAEMMDAVLAGQAEVTADDIIAYFQAGFGIAPGGDGSARDHRFIPDALAGGFRWDNRINWDSEELPTNGDSVDLGGNHVQYGGTVRIDDLDLGGGALYVNHGKLTVDGALDSSGGRGLIQTTNAGQIWTDGYRDNSWMNVEVEGGRFANTGDITGKLNLTATAGQTLLATSGSSYTVGNNAELRIEGSDVKVGFDGPTSGTARLSINDGGTLIFQSDADGFSTIGEFRSGHWNQTGTPVTSKVSLDGTLQINFQDYADGPGSHVLIAADQITGTFDEFQFRNLDASLDARVVVDTQADIVRLDVSMAGGPAPAAPADMPPAEEDTGSQTGGSDAPLDWLVS